MTKDDYVAYVKSTFITLSKRAIITWLSSLFPFLLNPFFAKVLELVAGKIASVIAMYGEMQAFFFYTDFRVGKQSDEFIEAAKANDEAQKNGTPEEKKNAEEKLINAFRTFAKFNL